MNAIDYRAWDLTMKTPVSFLAAEAYHAGSPRDTLPAVILLEVKVNYWGFETSDVIVNQGEAGTTSISLGNDPRLYISRNGTTCTIPVSDWPRVKAGLDAINASAALKAEKGERSYLPACCRQCDHKDDNPDSDPCKPCIAARSFEAKEQREKTGDPTHQCSNCQDFSLTIDQDPCCWCDVSNVRTDRFRPRPTCPTCGKA